MIEIAKWLGIGRRLLSAAVSLLLFLTSCGKKESAPESAEAPNAMQAVASPELPVNVPREMEEYKDPKGAFVVMLPKGYVFTDKTVGDKLKYIFAYGSAVNLILTQAAAEPEWDHAAQMAKKIDEIRTGRAGFPPSMVLLERGLISFGGLKGFRTLLSGNLGGQESQMMAHYLVGGEKYFTLIVTWKDPSASVLYGQVKNSITNSFRLASFMPSPTVPTNPAVAPLSPEAPAAAPVAATNIQAPVAPPVTHIVARPAHAATKKEPAAAAEPAQPADSRTESEWAAARAMLKFTGSMKMGGQEVAMVNDKILRKGDTISVEFHKKKFSFIVMIISPKGVEYKRSLKQ